MHQTAEGIRAIIAREKWNERYQSLHELDFKQRTPVAYRDGFYALPKMPKVSTANGLTTLAVNVFNWLGWHLERTNNMGRPVDKTKTYTDVIGRTRKIGSIEWQKGTGTKGTSDCKGHAKGIHMQYPIPVYIEIKAGRDRMSTDQKDYQHKVTSTGALHLVLKDPAELFEFVLYIYNMKL